MKCFYHNDLDGHCAASVVKSGLTLKKGCAEEFIEMNYNMEFPFDKIKKDEEVWIVDYHIKLKEMDKLLNMTSNIIWIDHHYTAIDEYKDYPHKIEGLGKNGVAGCVLTYMYIYSIDYKSVPMYIKLIGDRDVWKFEYGDDTRGFCMAMTTENTDPDSDIWKLLTDKDVQLITKYINKGMAMIQQRDIANVKFLKSWGYEASIKNFEHHKCFAMNKAQCGSEAFKSVDDKGYDIYISLGWDGEKWVISMYSTNVDVSVIAKEYGGGGHKGAAGFVSKELPIKKIKIKGRE